MREILERSPCPLCGESENSPYRFEHATVDGNDVALGLNRCKNCRLQYISPRLNYNGLLVLYNSYNEKTVSGKYNTDVDVSIGEYKSFSGYIKKYLPEGGTVLDVGCGVGNLLTELSSDRRYELSGVEFSSSAAEKAVEKGFSVTCGDLLSAHYAPHSFNAVVLLYVLEHVYNPREILDEANRLLKPGGFLFLAVPNYRYLRIAFDNPLSRYFLKEKASLHAEEHLQNFTPVTVEKMLEMARFEVVRQELAAPLNTGSSMVKCFKQCMYAALKILFLFGFNAGGIHIIAKPANNEK
jgi:2-polyprenyl-3-methyl-5-hydroxy-6-metoxy-1,4-benzoquinol methylase